MRKLVSIASVALIILTALIFFKQKMPRIPEIVKSPNSPYVGKVDLDNISIRLLILKHCPDQIADTDANDTIRVVNIAKSKGLTVKTIGNYRVDKNGRDRNVMWSENIRYDLEGLKKFISEQMKKDAEEGDTVIIYTIGHGSENGSLMTLGQRKNLMRAIAEAAEENEQETLWWQLSCHAAAELPAISSLSEKQQEFFSMSASSVANEDSYFRTQSRIFSAIFNAMATQDKEIDPDRDEIITAGELKDFIAKRFGKKRGNLIFAKSPEKKIFGYKDLANQMPIIDRNNPQGKYDKYIPRPKG